MSREFHRPALVSRADGVVAEVSPSDAGWSYSSMRVVEISPRGTYEFQTADSEWIVLPLAGSARVSCDGECLELIGRKNVFARVTDFAYVPRFNGDGGQPHRGTRTRSAGRSPSGSCPSAMDDAEDVPVEVRGAGSASRQCNNFCAPGAFETDRLVSVEVLVPAGNWASYPPHKHDEARDGEAQLEEIYYFEVAGGAGAGQQGPGGYQRVYTSGPGHEIDVLAEIKTGDVVLIPYGYHGPTMAAPGYDLYFLNVLAGPASERTMAFCDDPTHAWVRASWLDQQTDPRLPHELTSGTP